MLVSRSDNITSRSFGFTITLLIALQFVPTASNLWDVRGWGALLALAFPPVMVYRLLLFVEFKDSSFIYRLAGTGKPLATVTGNDLLFDVGVIGYDSFQKGINATFSVKAIITILLVATILLCCLFVRLLHGDVSASPVTTNRCVRENLQTMEVETSSSDIRIESDEEGDSEEVKNSIVSTKSYRRRNRVDSKEMDGNAGLEISPVSFLHTVIAPFSPPPNHSSPNKQPHKPHYYYT